MPAISRPKILIARSVFPDVVEKLSQYLDVEQNPDDRIFSVDEMVAKLRNKQGLFATPTEKITPQILQACPHLKAVCLMAVGYNNVDVAAATECGIMVTNTPDVLNETTADFAWALMMATARRITESEHWLRAGHWDKWRYDSFMGSDIHGATLGILGMGRIGMAIARRSIGFNMRVIYHNRRRLSQEQENYANQAEFVSKEELLKQSDHLILVLPYSPETHHTIDTPELALMKKSATLVNIARGGIVNDLALIAALRENCIAAAGLDVFENEPALQPAFLRLSNVVLTPHIGSASEATRRAMAHCAAENLIAALTNGKPANLLNPECMQHLR